MARLPDRWSWSQEVRTQLLVQVFSDCKNPGGGHVATIVIANHGPRGVQDSTPSNHYSLLQTIEDAFHLGCLRNTCDTANVRPLAALFAADGAGRDQ